MRFLSLEELKTANKKYDEVKKLRKEFREELSKYFFNQWYGKIIYAYFRTVLVMGKFIHKL